MSWHRRRTALATLLAVISLSGCAHRKRVSVSAPPGVPQVGYSETGIASWYGHPYHGRRAADGEIYDMETMTAAHRTLPFNTWVRVYDLDTRKTVDVRIIDRGPFVEGRVIDLSHAAARAIDMIGPGTARVRLEVIRLPAVPEPNLFAVQVGAFQDRDNAERLCERMQARYGTARLVLRPGSPSLWRVLVGSEPTQDDARTLAARIQQETHEKNDAFIVRLDSAS
jgi:peptidoglycan lytic transglycosylase